MEEKIFSLISKNPVSVIKNLQDSFDFVKSFNARVYFIQDSDLDTLTLYQENESSYSKGYCIKSKKNFKKEDNIIYFSSEAFKDFLIEELSQKKRVYDFCSIIVVNNFDYQKLLNSIIINLWIKIYKESDLRPYLVLLTTSDLVPKVDFKIDETNFLEFKKEEKREIIYHDKNYKLGDNNLYLDMFQKIKEYHLRNPVKKDETSTWVIFCSQKSERKKFSKIIFDYFKDSNEVYSFYKGVKVSSVKNIIKKGRKGKRKFLILEETIDIPICIKSIDGIFDCMTTNFNLKSDNVNLYISKNTAHRHLNCMEEGFCYRMCEKDFFDKLGEVDIKESERIYMENHFLEIIKNDLDPYEIFKGELEKEDINKCLQSLKEFNLVENIDLESYVMTKLGEDVLGMPLDIKNNIIIKNWEEDLTEISILISLIEMDKKIFSRGEISERFKNKDTLYILIKISLEVLKLEEKDIKSFCEKENLIETSVLSLISNFKNISEKLKFEPEIKDFDITLFLQKVKKDFEKVYFKEIYRLVDEEKKLYSNGLNEICSIDVTKFYNKNLYLPKKIIALTFINLNTDKESIQRRKKMIGLFLNLE